MVLPKVISLFFLALAANTVALSSQAKDLYYGQLETLAPDMVHLYQRAYSQVNDLSKLKIVRSPEKGAIISMGELIDSRRDPWKSAILLVEPPTGDPYLLCDENANGVFEIKERFPLTAGKEVNDFQTVLKLPLKNSLFKTFPVYFNYKRGFKHPKLSATERLIIQSSDAFAIGHVKIGGKPVLFQYQFDPPSPEISTTEGLFGVDVNQDGKIRNEQFSVETSYATNDEVPFPLGDIYVSTTKVDLKKNQIVVRKREKAEYKRIDLEIGKEMPDFTYEDFEGKSQKLSDLRGKYVLVDFWGVWCRDCTLETPFHLEAYRQFKARRFEILGLDTDENIEIAKAYIKKNNIAWPQAQLKSIKRLVEVSYRIQEYPSTLLLGPDGKVLILDQNALRGETLLQTLDRVLPR